MSDFETNMKIICLESKAFKALVSEVATQLRSEFFGSIDPWISEDEAMRILAINSKTTMKKYRDEGRVDYRKLENSNKIYYKRQSINDFIENSPK